MSTDLNSMSVEALNALALKNAEKKMALMEQLYGGEEVDDDPVVLMSNM